MPELDRTIELIGGDEADQWEMAAREWQRRYMELQDERALWKEAFTATRAYYSNNNGENSKRYREAVARLKEMRLIK